MSLGLCLNFPGKSQIVSGIYLNFSITKSLFAIILVPSTFSSINQSLQFDLIFAFGVALICDSKLEKFRIPSFTGLTTDQGTPEKQDVLLVTFKGIKKERGQQTIKPE